jgi:hypothetical protein
MIFALEESGLGDTLDVLERPDEASASIFLCWQEHFLWGFQSASAPGIRRHKNEQPAEADGLLAWPYCARRTHSTG